MMDIHHITHIASILYAGALLPKTEVSIAVPRKLRSFQLADPTAELRAQSTQSTVMYSVPLLLELPR